jgi:outer membrane protein OmpA-like peptidoglycan-associated protein
MKYVSPIIGAAALALTATAALADEAVPGPYATIGGIYNIVNKSDVLVSGTTNTGKFKDGWGLLAAGGYQWASGFRSELEFSHRDNSAKYLNTAATPLLGHQQDSALMVNVAYDFNTGGKLTPYLGAGIGVDWVKWSDIHTATSGSSFHGTNANFAWQGIAGVAYPIDSQLKLFAEYRYLQSDNHKYANTGNTALVEHYDNRTSQFVLGLRYSFGTPPKKEVAAAPPPPPPAPAPIAHPAPPPVPQKFLVFFDFDKSNLRSDAQKIVSEAVEYAKTNGKATIVTTGHADTSGSDTYNMALSERRAKTVQKELEKLGIPATEISVRWKGESEPLVQTGDGVKEPQNRRVEIVME